MTSARRRTAALGLGVTALLALTGCDKPSPAVTVFSGSESARSEARCWDRSGETVDPNGSTCSNEEGIKSLEVKPGQTIGISVDTSVADAGWFVAVGQTRLSDTLDNTYHRFTLTDQQLSQGPLNLQVIALDDTKKGPRGLWFVKLEKG